MSKLPSSDPVLEALLRRLDAVPPADLQNPPRWKQAAATDRRRLGLGALRGRRLAGVAAVATGALATAIVIVAVTGSSSVDQADAALLVFRRPAVDAKFLRRDTPVLARKQADYAKARAIDTPNGRGFVVPAADGSVCLAVPDDDGYGESCADADQIDQRGLPVALTSSDGGTMAAVLPSTASAATLHLGDGTQKPLAITDGVITAAATGKASVTYRLGAKVITVPLHTEPACALVGPGDPAPTAAQTRALHDAGMHYCDENAAGAR
jgi:hypothetical protein